MTASREVESALKGEYINNPMRTLDLTGVANVEDLIDPLREWAKGIGYKSA